MIKFLVLPRIKRQSELIKIALEGKNNAEKKAAEHLQELLLKHCMPVILKSLPNPNVGGSGAEDQAAHFVNEYGSVFGNVILQKVKQLKLSNIASSTMANAKQTVATPTN